MLVPNIKNESNVLKHEVADCVNAKFDDSLDSIKLPWHQQAVITDEKDVVSGQRNERQEKK